MSKRTWVSVERGKIRVTVAADLTDYGALCLVQDIHVARSQLRKQKAPQCWACGLYSCQLLHVGQVRSGKRGRSWETVQAVVEAQGKKTWRLRPVDGGKAFYVKRAWGRFVGWVAWATARIATESWNQWVRAVAVVGRAAYLAGAVGSFGQAMGGLARVADYHGDNAFERFRLLELPTQ